MALLRDLSELFPFQKDRSPFVKARLKLIDTLHAKVMVHYSAKQEPSRGELDFDEHLKNLQVNLEELSSHWKEAAPQDNFERLAYYSKGLKAVFPEKALGQVEAEGHSPGPGAPIWMAAKFMAHLEYEPLNNLAYLAVMLYALWVYWASFRESKPNPFIELSDDEIMPLGDFEAALDLSLAKLAYQVGVETSGIRHWGRREKTRTYIANKAKREKNERKAFIIAIYEHGKPIEVGTKFNAVCSIMQKQFKKWRGKQGPWGTIPEDPKKMKTPSLDSIDRWLKEAGIHDRDFKREGRYWIKQT